MVGRYRSRRDIDFCSTLTLPSKMENGHQPLCGSDDHLLCNPGGFIPVDSHGSYLDGVLGNANSKPVRYAMGQLQLASFMGRVRDFYLSNSKYCVLVCRFDTGFRNDSRPCNQPYPKAHL